MKIKLTIITLLFIAFYIFLFSNCMAFSAYKKPEIKEAAIPIMVDSSETVAIRKILIKIPYGTVVGKLYVGMKTEELKWETSTIEGEPQFAEGGSKILRNQGYNVIESSDDLFEETSSTAKARFQIGGIINKMFFNLSYKVIFGGTQYEHDLRLEIGWQVYDSLKENIVYKKTVEGQYYNKTNELEKIEAMVYAAYENAFISLLADEEFVKILTGKEVKTDTKTEEYPIMSLNYSAAPHGRNMPGDISDFFPGVVTIKSGLTHGSGVFITADGYILTAAHVVSGIDKVGIILDSGKKLEGKVIRINLKTDSALLKVETTNYDFLHVDFNKSKIGSEVYTIGTPLEKDLSYSVSKGIISGYRNIEGSELVQTDAAINPGSSGGPLLNNKGFLIGIISKKVVGTTVEGVGFAVSLNTIFEALKIKK